MFELVKENLLKRGYTVSCFETAAEAAEYMDGAINGKSVGFGGSMTLATMKLYEKLVLKSAYAHNEKFMVHLENIICKLN